MRKTIIIITFLLVTLYGWAQDTTNSKKFVDVSISLAGFGGDFVTNSTGIQLGAEFRLRNNVSMQCDLRYIFDVDSQKGWGQLIVDVDDLVGFAVNTEIKKYIRQNKNELKGGYYGGQALMMYTEAFQGANKIKRTKVGLYATLGWKYIAKSGFLFESMLGLGAQLISSNSSINTTDISSYSDEFPWSKPYESGTNLYPDLTWNVRLGWRF